MFRYAVTPKPEGRARIACHKVVTQYPSAHGKCAGQGNVQVLRAPRQEARQATPRGSRHWQRTDASTAREHRYHREQNQNRNSLVTAQTPASMDENEALAVVRAAEHEGRNGNLPRPFERSGEERMPLASLG
jgi:hypothetical protein